ncbi:MAG TPA: DUF6090 family protein [Yeosuana sp.]
MINFFRKIRKQMADDNRPLKYLSYAIGEIVLVVIGILIALQVNNWNESRLEQKRINQYAKSLVQDLKNDIDMLEVSLFQAEKKYGFIDSLRYLINHTPHLDLSNTDLYVIGHDIMYRPYKWNRTTFNELKNSGGLRYITNDSLQKKLVAYESFSNHLDEDFEFDKSNAEKADNMMVLLLNLNSPYITKMTILENNSFDSPSFNIYETEEYKASKANDLKLASYDEALIQKFVNTFIIIQDNYRTRAFKEMPEIIENAHELIALLKLEYNL